MAISASRHDNGPTQTVAVLAALDSAPDTTAILRMDDDGNLKVTLGSADISVDMVTADVTAIVNGIAAGTTLTDLGTPIGAIASVCDAALSDLLSCLGAVATAVEAQLAVAKDTLVAASGEKMNCVAANTDYDTADLVAGKRYKITSENGLLYVGVAAVYSGGWTDANILMAIPAGVTEQFTMPTSVDLHYGSPTAGTIGRLAEIVNT